MRLILVAPSQFRSHGLSSLWPTSVGATLWVAAAVVTTDTPRGSDFTAADFDIPAPVCWESASTGLRRRHHLPRVNTTNPSRFGILTFGSACASIPSFF